MTRESVVSALEQELSALVNAPVGELGQDRLLNQVVNSVGFQQLVVAMERRLGVTVDDEALYDAAPVTVGDMVDFLFSLTTQRPPQ